MYGEYALNEILAEGLAALIWYIERENSENKRDENLHDLAFQETSILLTAETWCKVQTDKHNLTDTSKPTRVTMVVS